MKSSLILVISTLFLFVLAGCGGSTATFSSPPITQSSSSSIVQSSSSEAESSSISSSSSEASSSSVDNGNGAGFTSGGVPYCTRAGIDPDGDGWGWENEASCVVVNSAADPDADPNFEGCLIGTIAWAYCATDNGSWGFENDSGCISQSFCPANRVDEVQTAMLEDLVDPDANAVTQAVFDYLREDVWGKKMLSGQQDLTWNDATDMYQRVLDDTGKAPAIMGYDYMEIGSNAGSGQAQTQEAIEHWNRGGLIAFCWHWRDPLSVSGTAEFYTASTDFQIPMTASGLDTESAAFAAMVVDLDLVAGELKELQEAGVTVLWRPLHEASGGWFWWGRPRTDEVSAAQANVALWQYIYDRYTNLHGLHNLIWVWNGQNITWYPGNAVVDIVSTDIYAPAQNYDSQIELYNTVAAYPQQAKIVALSENSNIPDPDAMMADNAWWLYFLTWNDGAGAAGVTGSNNFWTGEFYNTNAHKQHVYDHELVITLDELPDF